jgi:hypothetical protein
MSSSPKRSSKYKASYQAQPFEKNGPYSPESNQDASNPLNTTNSQEADGSTENSSAVIPALHRPPARPLAQPVSQTNPELESSILDAESVEIGRQQPIPPPSEPMQYRAIGLVKGRYIPSEQQLNRGVLLTTDGTLLDAVLLGRVMSLVKKHLDLEREYLWVVYPRTREKQRSLHIQILGVWEPAELNPDQSPCVSDPGDVVSENMPSDGYFSIRGEVVYQAEDKGYIVVKIRQAPRKDSEDAKAFKLRLEGILPTKTLGYFWNLDVRRQENMLVIDQGNSIAMIPPRKSKGQPKSHSRSSQDRKPQKSSRSAGGSSLPSNQSVREPVSKPIKRNVQRAGS